MSTLIRFCWELSMRKRLHARRSLLIVMLVYYNSDCVFFSSVLEYVFCPVKPNCRWNRKSPHNRRLFVILRSFCVCAQENNNNNSRHGTPTENNNNNQRNFVHLKCMMQTEIDKRPLSFCIYIYLYYANFVYGAVRKSSTNARFKPNKQ